MRKFESQAFYNEFKKFDLVSFIKKESNVVFEKTGDRWRCICPLPRHKEKTPSFFVYKVSSNNGADCWMFKCFGCGASGTIIDFCLRYRDYDYPSEALIYLSESLNIKESYELISKAIREARVDSNIKKKIDSEHYLASRTCYRLLKKYSSDKMVSKWVAKSYWQMNKMLKNEDFKGIEKISINASRLMERPNLVENYLKD